MRFAILGSRGFPSTYSGYETLVRRLAPALAEAGHHITVYSRDRVVGRRVWSDRGVRCIATAGYRSKSLSTLTFGFTGALDAARRRFDAVLVLNIANGYWLPLLSARGIPAAVNTDGVEWVRAKWGPVARGVFRGGAWSAARFSKELIADSREIASIWRERFGVPSTFIPYGADVCSEVDASRLAGLGLEKRGYVLVVARMVPENSVGLTLDACELVSANCRRPLVLVGTGDPRSALVQRLRRAHANGSVRWLGHVADQALLTELWSHCAVYVHGHSVGDESVPASGAGSRCAGPGAGHPVQSGGDPIPRAAISSRCEVPCRHGSAPGVLAGASKPTRAPRPADRRRSLPLG